MDKTVVVGMSGGVDSSVTAYLLKEKGYNVIGVTMQMWQSEDEKGCGTLAGVEDAKKVADSLKIPHIILDFKKEFSKEVISYFIDEYKNGRTPNPCNVCNRFIKWEALLNKAKELGADYVATGHYARIIKTGDRYAIAPSATGVKDQSYALYNLTQEQLSHTLMPCGEYTKDEIRAIAAKIGLVVADKPDSQDICFIPDGDHVRFITEATKIEPVSGNFVDKDGKVLGIHKGIIKYTIGQRRGLGIAAGHHIFVSEIRPETNEVVIGENEDIFASSLIADRVNYMGAANLDGVTCMAKIRYAHKGTDCTVTDLGDGRIRVDFTEPVRAITPGQAVVFYKDGIVLGGGTIIKKLLIN